MRKVINTNKAPKAVGPYSQAIVIAGGSTLFTAGQLGLDPVSGEMVPGEIEEQTRRALDNLNGVLQAAGTGLQNVVKTTVFLKNMDDFAAMNNVYADFFGQNPPARSAVQVARLPKDALIEIEAVALVENS